MLNADTGESLYTADFSSVKKPGDYRLVVPGVGQSAPFHISADVYREPYYTVMRGFYLWRCGIAVSSTYHGETFAHAACHTNDAWLDYVGGGHTHKDGDKGWHDAGDYNKYTVNAGVTLGVLFRAWEDFGPQLRKVRLDIPESGGKLPDFLAELKWEMDWVLTMQVPDGSVSHKLTHQAIRRVHPAGAGNRRTLFHALGQRGHRRFRRHDGASRPDFPALRSGICRPLPASRPKELPVFASPPGIS